MQSVFPKGRTRAREAIWPYRQILVVWIPLSFPLIWHRYVFEAHMDLFQHILDSHTNEGRQVVHFLLYFRSMQFILHPSLPPSTLHLFRSLHTPDRVTCMCASLQDSIPCSLACYSPICQELMASAFYQLLSSFPAVPRRLFFPTRQQEKQLDVHIACPGICLTKGLELRAWE